MGVSAFAIVMNILAVVSAFAIRMERADPRAWAAWAGRDDVSGTNTGDGGGNELVDVVLLLSLSPLLLPPLSPPLSPPPPQ